MHLAVMAVICGVKDNSLSSIIRAVLRGGPDVENNSTYQGILSYGAQSAFRALFARATGHKNTDEPNLAQLARRSPVFVNFKRFPKSTKRSLRKEAALYKGINGIYYFQFTIPESTLVITSRSQLSGPNSVTYMRFKLSTVYKPDT